MERPVHEQIDALLSQINEWQTGRQSSFNAIVLAKYEDPGAKPVAAIDKTKDVLVLIEEATRRIGDLLYEKLIDWVDENDIDSMQDKSIRCAKMAKVYKRDNCIPMRTATLQVKQRIDERIEILKKPLFLPIVQDILIYIETIKPECTVRGLCAITDRLNNLQKWEHTFHEYSIGEIQSFVARPGKIVAYSEKELLRLHCKVLLGEEVPSVSQILDIVDMTMASKSVVLAYLKDVMRRIEQTGENCTCDETVSLIQKTIDNYDSPITSREQMRYQIRESIERRRCSHWQYDEVTVKYDNAVIDVPLPKLGEEDPLAKYLYTLLLQLSSRCLSSQLNVFVQDYFEYAPARVEMNPQLYSPITSEIQSMFEKHGWSNTTPTGFHSEPNQKALVEGLHAIVDKYT